MRRALQGLGLFGLRGSRLTSHLERLFTSFEDTMLSAAQWRVAVEQLVAWSSALRPGTTLPAHFTSRN